MKIAIVDPFFDTSHAYWANGIAEHSQSEFTIFSNSPRHWKWQMVGGTMEISEKIRAEISQYDLLFVTDMLDLPTFLGYFKAEKVPPCILYFHENQITYPWSKEDSDVKEKRDQHYGFMNLRSTYMADHIVFNSKYHFQTFFNALPQFINKFPSIKWPFDINSLKQKSSVLPIGLNSKMKMERRAEELPVFLWNHRWEYDKGPDEFFEILFNLDKKDIDFGLIVLGKSYAKQPSIFEKAKEKLRRKIHHWGYLEQKEDYFKKLNEANILLVTSNQDFFGISVVEAIQYGCFPLLPNRLAYPEHLPEKRQDECLYNEVELENRLINIIQNKAYLDTSEYQNHINKYQWTAIINSYDDMFQSVVKLKSSAC